jgi:hypothetical protein
MTVANPFPLTGPDAAILPNGDVDPLGTETTSELQNLAQDCLHWLVCGPGQNPDNVNRGVGIGSYLSGDSDLLAQAPAAIETDFRKDTRIQDCAAQLLPGPPDEDGNPTYQIPVQVQPVAGAVVSLVFGWQQQAGAMLQSWQ